MKILIVGNKGSFLQDVISAFTGEGIISEVFYAPGTTEKVALDFSDIDTVLYISGETRFKEKMEWLNYQLPKILFEQAKEKKLGFIYLSSLSVFGTVDSDVITIAARRNPIDAYGISKNKFDAYVKNNANIENTKVGAILPASIHAGKGRSSVEKFDKLMSRFSLLKYFSLPGSLSYIKRDDLICIIVDAVVSERYHNRIASENYQLSRFANKKALKIPKIFASFFTVTNVIFGKRKSLVLRMLLRGIEYK